MIARDVGSVPWRRELAGICSVFQALFFFAAFLEKHELGFKNLFEYCRIHLGLGKGSVWSRTQVANVSRRFPQVLEYLVEGKVSLSSLGVLAAHLREENVERLLAQAEGKTKEEVKEIVAAIRPKPVAEPTIRRKPVRSWDESPERRSDSAEPAQPERPDSRGESESPKPAGSVEVGRPEVYNFRFSAGKSRLDEAAGAKKREAPRREGHERSRCFPSSVRERLLERADYQCEFRGPNGVRCTARTRLEVDHIEPVGKGGSCAEENLRVLCRGHNLLAAAREFGEAFMRAKIEGRERRAAAV